MSTDFISITGLQAQIHHLPERLPFLTGTDLAEAYGTNYRRLVHAVKRNPDRFPADFAFHLMAFEAEKLTQNASTSQGKRTDLEPLVFTHAGAIALSGVLKTPRAAEVSVIVHRAFAQMEQGAMDETRLMLVKLRSETLAKKPIYVRIRMALEEGMTLEELFRSTNYPRWKLIAANREMLAMKLVNRLLPGIQADLFAEV